ncbi:Trihelix transcription factor GTL2 [Spatholobus suberectus]|nr:Trihelix transcription factor GTL2 [Spatholobus suberectus]
MQPHYEMANTFYHELTVDPCRSSTLRPNQSGHQYHLQHYYPQFPQHPRQKQRHTEQCHGYEHFYQMCQHPNQFQASQQEQPQCLGVLNCRQPQEESPARMSFWKACNAVLSDAEGKDQEVNENFGELEAVYIKARDEDTRTNGVDGVRTRRGRKRRRKTKVEEELGLMGAFFEKLVKRVIKHQEGLEKKLLEVIGRMDKERAEWEEGWRRRETEIHDREAIVKARERDVASRRESSIVSTIGKITGQSFVLVSGKTRHQLSTIHED